MLPELGFDVAQSAATTESALAAVESREFDAAILDVNLAGVASYPVADALAAKGIPFLFATGYGTAALPERFSGRPILEKPYGRSQLETALHALMRPVEGGMPDPMSAGVEPAA
jgi:CheY-like chemotaxis protein